MTLCVCVNIIINIYYIYKKNLFFFVSGLETREKIDPFDSLLVQAEKKFDRQNFS